MRKGYGSSRSGYARSSRFYDLNGASDFDATIVQPGDNVKNSARIPLPWKLGVDEQQISKSALFRSASGCLQE